MKLCVHDGEVCSKFYPLGDNLLIDLEKQKIGVIKDKRGWALWQLHSMTIILDEWAHRAPTVNHTMNNVIQVPIAQFRDHQMIISDATQTSLEDVILSIHNVNLNPVAASHTYSMIIEQDEQEKNYLVLKACCNLGELREATTKTFFDCIPYVIYGNFYSSMLRAKKRRMVLLKTFIELLSIKEKEKAEEVIRVSLNTEGDFYKRSVKTEARRLLMDAFSWINSRPLRLHFSDEQWYQVIADKEKESLLYTIPYELFGLEIFTEMKSHYEMTLLLNMYSNIFSPFALRLTCYIHNRVSGVLVGQSQPFFENIFNLTIRSVNR